MMSTFIAFRCDGDRRRGAGHVSRCVALATAFRSAGRSVLFVGAYDGVARLLIEAAGLPTARPAEGPAGVPSTAVAAVVDSYDIPELELSELASLIPVVSIFDGARAPAVTAAISYRLDAAQLDVPPGTAGILGADYALVDPRFTTARRRRGLARALVSLGGGTAGECALLSTLKALLAIDGIEEVFVAGVLRVHAAVARDGRIRTGVEPGLAGLAGWADIAVAAAGTTAYDLACAGVPSVLNVIAANQLPFARALGRGGVALIVDRQRDEDLIAATVTLTNADVRRRLALAGPALIDGYGAFRARDAAIDAFAGRSTRRPLRYRPATAADSALILRWRNDPAARAASRNTALIEDEAHARWFSARTERFGEPLLIIEDDCQPIGSVRFDRVRRQASISVALDREHRGAGLGTRAIRETCELLLAAAPEIDSVSAEVRKANVASRRAFARAGFATESEGQDWARLRLARRQDATGEWGVDPVQARNPAHL